MIKIIEKITNGCYFECTFFNKSGNCMECCHPFFDDKNVYENMIITQENSRDGNIPEKCPLRANDIEIRTTVKLNLLST